MRVWLHLLGRMHDFSERVYDNLQANTGFLLNVAGRKLDEFVAEVRNSNIRSLGNTVSGAGLERWIAEIIPELADRKECCARYQAFLDYYADYLERETAMFQRYPVYAASFWDPQCGIDNLRRELHRFKLWCGRDCLFCQNDVPQVEENDIIEDGAHGGGIFVYPPFVLGFSVAGTFFLFSCSGFIFTSFLFSNNHCNILTVHSISSFCCHSFFLSDTSGAWDVFVACLCGRL
jgi:hypothetical protein